MGNNVKRDTKKVGDRSEVVVLAALVQAGYVVAVPYGENQRWDFVVEKDGKLSRVQVKTGRLRNGAITFNCHSLHWEGARTSCRPYRGHVELFGVYCPDVTSVYLVPVEEMAAISGALRVIAPRNAQVKKIRWASEYLIARVQISSAISGMAAPSLPGIGISYGA